MRRFSDTFWLLPPQYPVRRVYAGGRGYRRKVRKSFYQDRVCSDGFYRIMIARALQDAAHAKTLCELGASERWRQTKQGELTEERERRRNPMITLTAFADQRRVQLRHRRYGKQRIDLWTACVSSRAGAILRRGRFRSPTHALEWASTCVLGYSLGETAEMLGVPIHDMAQAWEDGRIRTIDYPNIIIVPDEERERLSRVLAEFTIIA